MVGVLKIKVIDGNKNIYFFSKNEILWEIKPNLMIFFIKIIWIRLQKNLFWSINECKVEVIINKAVTPINEFEI